MSSARSKGFANDNRAAFQPFGLERHSYIGQTLAYAEMRLILTKLFFTLGRGYLLSTCLSDCDLHSAYGGFNHHIALGLYGSGEFFDAINHSSIMGIVMHYSTCKARALFFMYWIQPVGIPFLVCGLLYSRAITNTRATQRRNLNTFIPTLVATIGEAGRHEHAEYQAAQG